MTDCLSCKHAEPARAPDGSIDFRIKNCKRFPPTPIVLMGPQGRPMMSSAFPTVGPGVLCAEHAVRGTIACCDAYVPRFENTSGGPCVMCGFPKMTHKKTAVAAVLCPQCLGKGGSFEGVAGTDACGVFKCTACNGSGIAP